MRELTVGEGLATRIDLWLSRYDRKLSRSAYHEHIKNGRVLVNGKTVKPSYTVLEHDRITLVMAEEPIDPIRPVQGNLDIVFEDGDMLIVNKPS